MMFFFLLFNLLFAKISCPEYLYDILYRTPVEIGLEINDKLTRADILDILDNDQFKEHYLALVREYHRFKNLTPEELKKLHYSRYQNISSDEITLDYIDEQAKKYVKTLFSYKDYLEFSTTKKKSESDHRDFINDPQTYKDIVTYGLRFITKYPDYFSRIEARYLSNKNIEIKKYKNPRQLPENKYKSIHELLDSELEDYLTQHKKDSKFSEFQTKILYFLFTKPPSTDLTQESFIKATKKDFHDRMGSLLNLFIKDKQEREAIALKATAKPISPVITSSEPKQYSHRPLRENAKKETEIHTTHKEPTKVNPNFLYENLSPLQREQLIEINCVTTTIGRVNRSLKALKDRLSDKEYKRVEKRLVETILLSTIGKRVEEIEKLYQTRSKDIFEINPRVSSNVRIFFGKGPNNTLKILSVEYDVKSGGDWEHKRIQTLDSEWQQIKRELGY